MEERLVVKRDKGQSCHYFAMEKPENVKAVADSKHAEVCTDGPETLLLLDSGESCFRDETWRV